MNTTTVKPGKRRSVRTISRSDASPTLSALTGLLALTIIAACSTIAEPAEEGPPVCDCDPGERKLQCRTGEHFVDSDKYNNTPTSAAYSHFCFDTAATEEEKRQACLDACNEWLDDAGGLLYCNFLSEIEPYRWASCLAPEAETTGGEPDAGVELTCPGWYAPNQRTTYEPLSPSSAAVHIDRGLVEQLIADPMPLYVCDSARYEELEPGVWTFVDVEPSDLLHHLGLRSGDGVATVEGIEPTTGAPSTPAFRLDSLDAMLEAYDALHRVDALHLSVARTQAPGGTFDIHVSIDR